MVGLWGDEMSDWGWFYAPVMMGWTEWLVEGVHTTILLEYDLHLFG